VGINIGSGQSEGYGAMTKVKLEQSYYQGFPYIKIEGDLTVDNFAAIHLMVKGATRFGTIPVIVDLSGDLNITDEVKEIKCWREPPTIPDFAKKVTLAVIGTAKRVEEIRALLTPHDQGCDI
jgi:hypothetical protein